MHDTSGAGPGDPPVTRRTGGPRHAAPDDGPGATPPPVPTGEGHRAAHRRTRRTAPAWGRGRWSALLAAVLAVAAVVVVGLVRGADDRTTEPADSAATGPATASDGGPAPPADLLDWLATELPAGGTVAAPPELRARLLAAGADPAVLPESAPAEAGAGRAGIPALTLAEDEPEGGRVLARFDLEATPLILVDPSPVEATDEQRQQREALAAAVLANPTTRAEGDARAVLAAADVDPRLLAVVAALTAQEGIGLWAFPALPGEVPGSAPARRVVVDAVGGRPVPADGAVTQRLIAWLDAQLGPFAPDTVEVTGDGVLIGFDYVPGPDAVVASATP